MSAQHAVLDFADFGRLHHLERPARATLNFYQILPVLLCTLILYQTIFAEAENLYYYPVDFVLGHGQIDWFLIIAQGVELVLSKGLVSM